MRVGVIGAGPAGLTAADRVLLSEVLLHLLVIPQRVIVLRMDHEPRADCVDPDAFRAKVYSGLVGQAHHLTPTPRVGHKNGNPQKPKGAGGRGVALKI